MISGIERNSLKYCFENDALGRSGASKYRVLAMNSCIGEDVYKKIMERLFCNKRCLACG